MDFYDKGWNLRGTKRSFRCDLSKITGIEVDVLQDSDLLHTVPVGRRMSWAAGRKTTRVEDSAYCLLGIFDVNMPMIYGEGKNAFLRLQEEIAKTTYDLTLFAWTSQDGAGVDRRPLHWSQMNQDLRGILAHSPKEFMDCGRLKITHDRIAPTKEFAMTNKGLRIETSLGSSPGKEYIFSLDCVKEDDDNEERLGIYLMKTEFGYVRAKSAEWFSTTDQNFWTTNRPRTIYIARKLSKNIIPGLRQQLKRSLKFHFTLFPAGNYKVQNIKPRPSALWDHNSKLFLTSNRKDFTGIVEFTIRPRYWRFVIVCGLIDVKSEHPRIKDPWSAHHDDLCPWMAIFTDRTLKYLQFMTIQGNTPIVSGRYFNYYADTNIETEDPVAKTQLEIIDKLKSASDDLRKLRETVLSWHEDKDRAISISEMAGKPKVAYDEDDGDLQYSMDMYVFSRNNLSKLGCSRVKEMPFSKNKLRPTSATIRDAKSPVALFPASSCLMLV